MSGASSRKPPRSVNRNHIYDLGNGKYILRPPKVGDGSADSITNQAIESYEYIRSLFPNYLKKLDNDAQTSPPTVNDG